MTDLLIIFGSVASTASLGIAVAAILCDGAWREWPWM